MTTAYPLAWPPEYERTEEWEKRWWPNAPSTGLARDQLLDELDLSGAINVVISTNMRLRQDGQFHAGAGEPTDSGVAVYFTMGGDQRVMACDSYKKLRMNLRALALTIGDLRRIEKRGVNDFSKRVFEGFKALPESTGAAWWDVLGVSDKADDDTIKKAYRKLAKTAHPDTGGSVDEWLAINGAYQQALNRSAGA